MDVRQRFMNTFVKRSPNTDDRPTFVMEESQRWTIRGRDEDFSSPLDSPPVSPAGFFLPNCLFAALLQRLFFRESETWRQVL